MSLVFSDTGECQKIQKIAKNNWRKSSYLLKQMMDFNEMFRKIETCDNIKNHGKSGLHPLENKI